MKSVARMALMPGMILGEDIQDLHGKIIFQKGDALTTADIDLLKRYSIMCVTVMEDIDLAETHYEKLQFDNAFRAFGIHYSNSLNQFKTMMNGFVQSGIHIEENKLLALYANLRTFTENGSMLLDYLYHLMPNEDLFTYSHFLNSALIAGVFAEWLSLNKRETDLLILSAFYYDIGKLLLPQELLWKTGKLSHDEFQVMKSHTVIGYKLVKDTNLDIAIKRSVVMHHERLDGSGYPHGLMGEALDLYTRLLPIIDTYEAMASPRTYRSSIHPLNIIASLESNYQIYDSALLLPILRKIAESQIGCEVHLNNGDTYEVMILNNHNLSRPILKNKNNELLNLADYPELMIQ